MTAVSGLIPVGSIQQGSSCFSSHMYMKLSIPQIPGNPKIQKVTLDMHQERAYGSDGLRLCLYPGKKRYFLRRLYPGNGNFHVGLGTTHELGAFGRATVELQSGALSVVSEDLEWLGNRMPVSLRHTFSGALSGQQYTNNPAIDLHTADFHAMHLGNGWKLNYMQSVMPKTFLHDATRRSGYVYTDESGAQVYMIESTKFYFRRETPEEEGGEEYYLYEDLDDSGYLYDPKKREIYHCADTYIFDTDGRLVAMLDQNDNTMQIVSHTERGESAISVHGWQSYQHNCPGWQHYQAGLYGRQTYRSQHV